MDGQESKLMISNKCKEKVLSAEQSSLSFSLSLSSLGLFVCLLSVCLLACLFVCLCAQCVCVCVCVLKGPGVCAPSKPSRRTIKRNRAVRSSNSEGDRALEDVKQTWHRDIPAPATDLT